MPQRHVSRVLRVAGCLLFLAGAAGTVPTAAHSDMTSRPAETERHDSWEGAVVRLDRTPATNGGISDGDDWLG